MADYNLYDVDALREAAARVKQFDTSTRTKARHRSTVYELKEHIESLMIFNKYIFNPDYFSPFADYYKAVNLNKSVKILNSLLRIAIKGTIQELSSMANVENQTRTGELIEIPKGSGHWIQPQI